MPSETDPLLPQGNSAPEITGYGFSKPSTNRYDLYNEAAQTYNEAPQEADDPPEYYAPQHEQPQRQTEGGASPFRTFAGLFTIVVGVALVITVLMPGVLDKIWNPSDWYPPWSPKSPTTIPARVFKILSSTPLIDGHNDLAIKIRFSYHNNIYSQNFTTAFSNGSMDSQVDLPRLKTGRVGGSFWSAFTPCLANGTDFDDDAIHARSVATTLSQIDVLRRLTEKYGTTFASPLLNSTAALAAFKSRGKLMISPLGIEGLHQIGHSLSNLRLYHSLGVKYATLTHNCYNHYADPALLQDYLWNIKAAPAYWNGLSPAGITIVKEMNRMGMLVDLSHVSKVTMLDVLGGNTGKFEGSAAPVIFSHSSSYALCPHPRNVPDDVLQLVKETKSLVMVNFAPDFISCVPAPPENDETGLPVFYEKNSTLRQVARHITYIGGLIGYEYVGIGSDFDGIPEGPRGLENVGNFPELVGELLRLGVGDEDVGRVVGGNLLRVWGEAERVGESLREDGVLPAEDEIKLLG